MDQFRRLARQLPAKEERDDAREDFQRAMVLDFNETFGVDVNNLTSWQELCSILSVDPIPDDIKGCRSVSCCLVLVVLFQLHMHEHDRNSRRSMLTLSASSIKLRMTSRLA